MTAACSLCLEVFPGPSAGALLNAHGQDAIQQYLVNLAQHIRQAHEDVAGHVELSALEYRGYLLMGYYNITDDPQFVKMREDTRRLLHSTTRKVTVTNEELRASANGLSKSPAIRDHIYAAMVELRDRLCELGEEPSKLTH